MSEPILITKLTKKGPSMGKRFQTLSRHKKPTIDSLTLAVAIRYCTWIGPIKKPIIKDKTQKNFFIIYKIKC